MGEVRYDDHISMRDTPRKFKIATKNRQSQKANSLSTIHFQGELFQGGLGDIQNGCISKLLSQEKSVGYEPSPVDWDHLQWIGRVPNSIYPLFSCLLVPSQLVNCSISPDLGFKSLEQV